VTELEAMELDQITYWLGAVEDYNRAVSEQMNRRNSQ